MSEPLRRRPLGMPDEVWSALDSWASSVGLSTSALVRTLVMEALREGRGGPLGTRNGVVGRVGTAEGVRARMGRTTPSGAGHSPGPCPDRTGEETPR